MSDTQQWQAPTPLEPHTFTCGHPGCGKRVASSAGLRTSVNWAGGGYRVFICPDCARPTFVIGGESGVQVPGPLGGRTIDGLPRDVSTLYDQARSAYSVGAYTAAVLAIRKILMHVAVEKGASPGQKFVEYVAHLDQTHWIPPGSTPWVDHMRTRGNEENHEIVLASKEDADELLAFVEVLLIFVYEVPSKMPGAGSGAST